MKLAIVVIVVAIMLLLMYGLPCRATAAPIAAVAAATGPSVVVYGSKTCPWCVKQEEYLTNKGLKYEFVNCAGGNCPEFVEGFPTLVVDGQVRSGYTEI
jgi:glutaredoxin